MTEAVLRGGPEDGKRYTVSDPPPPQIYVMKPPDLHKVWGSEATSSLDLDHIVVYERVGRTNEYVCLNDVDRVQEVINFARGIGLDVDYPKEQYMRHWWNES